MPGTRSTAAVMLGGVTGDAYLAGYFHENVASGPGSVHRVHDGSNMNAQRRPLLVAENHNSDLAALQVLLISEVLVGGNQYFKTSGFSRIKQIAVR